MEKNEKSVGNLPEMKLRAGAVSPPVGQNEGQRDGEVTQLNPIAIGRSYKGKKDVWQNANSLRINDLPKAGPTPGRYLTS